MIVRPGEKIPLGCQVWDGAESLTLQAILKKADETVWDTVALTSAGDGMYIDDSLEMPSFLLFVTYVPYSDPGMTVESDRHCRGVDVFENLENRITQDLVGEVSRGVLESTLTGASLTGTIESNELTALVEKNEEEGAIATPSITGTTDSDDIDGTTVC